jgi:OCT family organic cation transporter-like MFS transporter 18
MPTSSPTAEASSSDRAALWITYVNIILYALCFQLQQPVEPFLIQALSEKTNDVDAVNKTYGQLIAFFSAIQTIGSPLVGILLDRVGIRYTSGLVFLASAASYAILASASDLNFLFLSKVPTALQHAFLVAQATAATSTRGDAAARAQALGRMTTAYTIGATIGTLMVSCNVVLSNHTCHLPYPHHIAGPALGGYLVDTVGDLYLGAKLAVVGSLISVVLSLLFLPNAQSSSINATDIPVKKRSFVQELRKSGEIALRSNLWPLLIVKVIGGISASMHSTALPLVLTQKLHFEPSQLGLAMSTSMFAVAGFGAICMAPLTFFLGAPGMARTGLVARALLATLLATIVAATSSNNVDSVMRVVVAYVLHSLASHVLATGLTTQTTGNVSKTEQGALLGLEHGLFSLARIGAPPLSTFLLSSGSGSFWRVAGVCSAIDLALVGSLIFSASEITRASEIAEDASWPSKDEEHSR